MRNFGAVLVIFTSLLALALASHNSLTSPTGEKVPLSPQLNLEDSKLLSMLKTAIASNEHASMTNAVTTAVADKLNETPKADNEHTLRLQNLIQSTAATTQHRTRRLETETETETENGSADGERSFGALAARNGTREAFTDDVSGDALVIINFLDFLDNKVMAEWKSLMDENKDLSTKLKNTEKTYTKAKETMMTSGADFEVKNQRFREKDGEREANLPVYKRELATVLSQLQMIKEFDETLDKLSSARDESKAAEATHVSEAEYDKNIAGMSSLLETEVSTHLSRHVSSLKDKLKAIPPSHYTSKDIDAFISLLETHARPVQVEESGEDAIDESTHRKEVAAEPTGASDGSVSASASASAPGVFNGHESHSAQTAAIKNAVERLERKLSGQAEELRKAMQALESSHRQAQQDEEKAKLKYKEDIDYYRTELAKYSELKLLQHKSDTFQEELKHLLVLRQKIMTVMSIGTGCSTPENLGKHAEYSSNSDDKDADKYCFAVFSQEEMTRIMEDSVKQLKQKSEAQLTAEGHVTPEAMGGAEVVGTAPPDDFIDLFDSGRTLCRHWGGEVASIHNQQENDVVLKIGQEHGGFTRMLLGFDDYKGAREWTWTDGTEFDWNVGTSSQIKLGNFATSDQGWYPRNSPPKSVNAFLKKRNWECPKPKTAPQHDNNGDPAGMATELTAERASGRELPVHCWMGRFPGETDDLDVDRIYAGLMIMNEIKRPSLPKTRRRGARRYGRGVNVLLALSTDVGDDGVAEGSGDSSTSGGASSAGMSAGSSGDEEAGQTPGTVGKWEVNALENMDVGGRRHSFGIACRKKITEVNQDIINGYLNGGSTGAASSSN